MYLSEKRMDSNNAIIVSRAEPEPNDGYFRYKYAKYI